MPRALLFVTRKWPPALGGMETYSARLFERLSCRRPVDLLALPGRADGRAPSVAALLVFGLYGFVRVFLRAPGGIVHVSDVASWPLAWAAAFRSRNNAIVISAHGTDLSYATRDGWRARAYDAYLRLGARLLPRAHIVANSRWIARLAHTAGFSNVSVVRMGVDLKAPAEPRSNNGCVLFAGRITAGKGLRFLVEDVLPLLVDPPKLRVAGSIWDPEEGAYLASPHVEWLGPLPPDELAGEYAAALAVLMPSRLPEGFGLVAAEAAACGGVVLAANHSGLAEAVLPGAGFLVPPDDANAWAERLAEIGSWPAAAREAFQARSAALARDAYDWDRTADETEVVYAKLSDSRSNGAAALQSNAANLH